MVGGGDSEGGRYGGTVRNSAVFVVVRGELMGWWVCDVVRGEAGDFCS